MPEGIRLFGRKAIVSVDTVQVECGAGTGLDVEFDVSKDLSGKPNTASLKIWNLNEDHRKALSAKAAGKNGRARVRIEAGYVSGTSRIFEGDVRHLWHEREPNSGDIATICETGDGERYASRANIARSWAPGTPVEVVVRDVARSLGAGDGNLVTAVAGAVLTGWGPTYTQGASVSGKTLDVLNKLTRSVGLEWSIQDGVLQFLGSGKALEGTAVLLKEGTGLVGSPSVDHTGKDAGHVLFKCLMIPDIFPGRKVRIEAEDIRGNFRVEKAKYTGATSGPEWYITGEARPL